jgi:SAM-dependent methyltransferase
MTTHSICILGRQPELGLAELESLYGAEVVSLVNAKVASVELPTDSVDFDRLGGSTRLAGVLSEVPSTNWKLVEKELQKVVRSTAFALPTSGKFHLGLSAVGFDISAARLNAVGLTLKKLIRSRYPEGSVRLVPNNDPELSTAQVYHSHLADEHGAELLIIAAGSKTVIARTAAVQDIDSYTLRDRGRPKRDSRVGMLPPKLAQTIINLATGPTSVQHPTSNIQILDPFCGTGVVLQEALLMGYAVYGTDLEPRMVDYTRANLEWLPEHYKLQTADYKLEIGDATTHTWGFDARSQTSASNVFVAGEAYLGRPFTEVPSREVLEQTASDVNAILTKFLSNIRSQLTPGTRLCLAVPAWQIQPNTFRHLPLIDHLSDLGYNQVEFERVSGSKLLYYREDQVVARELLVLTVK